MQKWQAALIVLVVVTLVFVFGPQGTRPAGTTGLAPDVPDTTVLPPRRLIAVAAGRDAAAAFSAYRTLERIGYCPYLSDSPETPIGMLTAAYGATDTDVEQVRATILLLLRLGCDINQYNGSGLTPLHNAILFRQPELFDFLLAHGADPLLRVIQIPGREDGQRIAHLDAYGMTQLLHRIFPDDDGLRDILSLLGSDA